METRKENSYGIIPFYKDNDEIKVFLIHQISRGGKLIWTFPKGHEEEGESPLDTARREVFEETGMRPSVINETKAYSLSYDLEYNDVRIQKTTTYFVGTVDNVEFTIQETEVARAGWFTIDRALEKLTYDNLQDILTQALQDLDN